MTFGPELVIIPFGLRRPRIRHPLPRLLRMSPLRGRKAGGEVLH